MVDFAHVPKFPTRLLPQTANFIQDIAFHGCARPWYVYVQTFAPAFLELILTLTIYDLEDLMRMRGESIVRKGRGQPGFNKKHLFTKPIKTINAETKRYSRIGLKTLLVVTTPLELVGFGFLFYFAVDNFYGRWQSLLEQSDFCKNPIESGPFTRRRDGGSVSVLPGGAAIPLPQLQQNRAAWSSTPVAVGLPQGQFRAFFGLTVTGPVGGISGMKLRLFIVGGLGGFNVDGEEVSAAEGQEVTMMVDARFFLPGFAGGSVAWELVGPAVPVGLKSEDGFFTVSRFG
jgi:hypothetical protein